MHENLKLKIRENNIAEESVDEEEKDTITEEDEDAQEAVNINLFSR